MVGPASNGAVAASSPLATPTRRRRRRSEQRRVVLPPPTKLLLIFLASLVPPSRRALLTPCRAAFVAPSLPRTSTRVSTAASDASLCRRIPLARASPLSFRPSSSSPSRVLQLDATNKGFGGSAGSDASKGGDGGSNGGGGASSSSLQGEFELQELRAQLDTMVERSISPRNLSPEKRAELEEYVRTVCLRRSSPIPLRDVGDYIKGATYQLTFGTEGGGASREDGLPADSTVLLRFAPEEQTLEYVLKFGERTMGLNELTAGCTYFVDASPVNPGLVTFVYQDIQTNFFGLNLPVGAFGLLKGRANYVETVWFDGKLWFERGFGQDGKEYYNVYVRVDKKD